MHASAWHFIILVSISDHLNVHRELKMPVKKKKSGLLLASSLAVGRESEHFKKVYYSLLQPYKMLTLRCVSSQGSIPAYQAAFASAELHVATTTPFAAHQPAHMCYMHMNTDSIYSR